jgi:putative hydroxymethylpyrimidine transport system permease protein
VKNNFSSTPYYSALAVIALIFLWQTVIWISSVPDYLLPTPNSVAAALWHDATIIQSQLGVTIIEWVAGLGLSFVFGLLLSLIAFYSKLANQIIKPILVASQAVPFLALAPLFMIWLGLGMAPKIALVVLSCVFPIALEFLEGLEDGRIKYADLSFVLHLSPIRSLRHIYAPHALPRLLLGVKMSASYAFVTTVMAELIGSESGLGVYLIRAQTSYRTERVFAAVVVIVVTSLLTTKLIDAIRKKFVFWEHAKPH